MQHMGISARIRRKKVNRKSVTPNQIGNNILQPDFNAQKPNKKWLTDVTEFSISSDSKKIRMLSSDGVSKFSILKWRFLIKLPVYLTRVNSKDRPFV